MSDPARLRVLCVVPRGLAGRGGIETLFSHVAASVDDGADCGFTLEFLTSRGDASGAGWVLRFPFAVAQYTWRLATRRYDLVHLNTSARASSWRKAVLQAVAGLFGVPVVVQFHSSALPAPGAPAPAWTVPLGRVFRKADAVIALGSYWRDYIARYFDMPIERFHVVLNGVPDFAPGAPARHARSEPVHLLFAGNLTTAKGVDTLLEALARLPADLPAWHATLAGTGDVAGFRERTAALGLGARVEFTGWIAQAQIKSRYRDADIVVLPSRNEALPVCLIEGACAGAALVATPVGSVPEVVRDAENGFLVPVGDAEGLTAALAALIADPARLSAFRSASRRIYLEKFRLETMLEGLGRVYRKVLADRRNAPRRQAETVSGRSARSP